MHSVNLQTDGQMDDRMIPVADHTVLQYDWLKKPLPNHADVRFLDGRERVTYKGAP